MVKIGFICEGKTEVLFISSEKFISFLNGNNVQLIDVVNAGGSGNLLPHNITQYLQLLEAKGAEKIFILTDLDEDECITVTKQRINAREKDIVVIAVKQIEAWFLASTQTMQQLLNDDNFTFEFPEKESNAFETIRSLMIQKTGRGIYKGVGGKIKLVHILLSLGLDISQAASHPNCPSAAYFLDKINTL